MSTLILPSHEHITLEESHQPTFDRRFMIGSTIVGALVGPSYVGRGRLIDAMSERYPEVTPFDAITHQEAADQHELHIVGLVTDSDKWFADVARRMPPSAAERQELRDRTIEIMKWLLGSNQEQLPLVYIRRKHEDIAAQQLYTYLTEGTPLPHHIDNRKLAQRLLWAAETMGTD